MLFTSKWLMRSTQGIKMEQIQFLNYVLSIVAVLLAAYAFWSSFRQDEKNEWQFKDLREQIRLLKNKEAQQNGRK